MSTKLARATRQSSRERLCFDEVQPRSTELRRTSDSPRHPSWKEIPEAGEKDLSVYRSNSRLVQPDMLKKLRNHVGYRHEGQSRRDKRRGSHDSGFASMNSDMVETDSMPEASQAEAENQENEAIAAAVSFSGISLSKKLDCKKQAIHDQFIPVKDFSIGHLPPSIQTKEWHEYLLLKTYETVKLTVEGTSKERPPQFQSIKGNYRTGSGTAFMMEMANAVDCKCSKVEGPHKISGIFKVMTAAHVVYNDEEAQKTKVEFFLDDEGDMSSVVTAHGVQVCHVDIDKNRSVIECRTHDLTLCERLEKARQRREELRKALEVSISHKQVVVLISHPHGCAKHISFGELKELQPDGEIKMLTDGTQIVGCIVYFTSPSCPGSGGGTVNVLGGGEVCLAFAPHCASFSNGENVSGLGWTKYPSSVTSFSNSLQLRN